MDCETVGPGQPLRQGDVLKRFSPDPDSTYCVVISADCDLAHEKSGEHGVACLEMLRLSDYLTGTYAAQLLRKHRSRALRELNEWIQAKWRQNSPGSDLAQDAIDSWIDAAPLEEIEETLGLEPQPENGTLRRLYKALRRTHKCLQKPSFDEVFTCMLALQANAPSSAAEFVRNQLGRLDAHRLPDDLFFISELPDEEGRGFIVSLRRMIFINATTIVGDVPTARERQVAFVRIGRLTPTFKHGIAQQFGSLYARIGYPQPYEDARALTFSLVLDEISAEWANASD